MAIKGNVERRLISHLMATGMERLLQESSHSKDVASCISLYVITIESTHPTADTDSLAHFSRLDQPILLWYESGKEVPGKFRVESDLG